MKLYLATVRMTIDPGASCNKVTFVEEMKDFRGKRVALVRDGANYRDVLAGYVYAPDWLGGLRVYNHDGEDMPVRECEKNHQLILEINDWFEKDETMDLSNFVEHFAERLTETD